MRHGADYCKSTGLFFPTTSTLLCVPIGARGASAIVLESAGWRRNRRRAAYVPHSRRGAQSVSPFQMVVAVWLHGEPREQAIRSVWGGTIAAGARDIRRIEGWVDWIWIHMICKSERGEADAARRDRNVRAPVAVRRQQRARSSNPPVHFLAITQ